MWHWEGSDGLSVRRQRPNALGTKTEAGPVHSFLAEHEFVTILEDAVLATEREIFGRVSEHVADGGLIQDGVINHPVTRLYVEGDLIKPVRVGISRDLVALRGSFVAIPTPGC